MVYGKDKGMANTGKRGKGKRRKAAFQPHGNGLTFAPAPDPQSPMGRATEADGTRFRTSPYLMTFVRPLIPDEFDGRQVVSPERMQTCTHIFVTRIDPTSVARTRIPITSKEAERFQAFSVLEQEEILHVPPQGIKWGHLSLPEETSLLTVSAAALGMHAAFQGFPQRERNISVLETHARELADMRVRVWPDIANDGEMYVRLFVPAFVFGYRYGHKTIHEASGQERTQLLEGVCFQPSLAAQTTIAKVLQDRIQEMQAQSIYELDE